MAINDPILYYTFDAASISGTTVTDSGSGGNNGTTVGSPVTGPGQIKEALVLNGTTQYVSVANNVNLELGSGDFTIASWVNPHVTVYGPTASGVIISKDFLGVELFIYQGKFNAYIGGVANSISGVATLVNDTWQHFALTRVGSTVTAYINGVVDATVTNSASISNSGVLFNVGRRTGEVTGITLLNGAVDETRIFGRGLSPTEIAALMAFTGAGKFPEMFFGLQ